MKTQREEEPPQIGAEIVRRMAQAYGVGDTVAALAAAMNRPQGTVKNWGGRGSVPLQYLLQARAETKRTLDWLVLGEEPQVERGDGYVVGGGAAVHLHVSEPSARAWLRHQESDDADAGTPQGEGHLDHVPRRHPANGALLPVTGPSAARPLVLSMELGGAGEQQVDYEVIPKLCGGANGPESGDAPLIDRAGEMAMTYEWLQRNLGHTTGDLASVRVIGDSMQPTLLDGDTIVIDRGVCEFGPDAIYAVHMLGQRLVKRVQRKLDGSVVIISDNVAYERETVPRSRVREIQVLGRMVWPRVR